MNRKTLRVITFGMVLCSVGVVLGSATPQTDSTLAEIAQYRQWTRLNDKPIVVHSFMTHVWVLPQDWRVGGVPMITSSKGTTSILMPGALILADPRPAPRSERIKDKKTHQAGGDSFGFVYANNLAHEGMIAEPSIRFARGSIIVREKLVKADDQHAQILAVMIKRARGFNPAANDWEFLLVDGAMTKIQERQKKGSCLDCHKSQRTRDFVHPPPPR